MVSIASLLNPLQQSFQEYRDPSSPCSSTYTPSPSSPLPPSKKQKMSKDAAIFAKGKTEGEVRYAPCEIQDEEIAVQHDLFQLYPMGHISDYCRHIPYNSEKKSFLEKTGRESFEGEAARKMGEYAWKAWLSTVRQFSSILLGCLGMTASTR